MCDPSETDAVIQRCLEGDQKAIRQLLEPYRERLKRAVRLRMDPRLAAKVDASDVVQEASAEAIRRLPVYAADRPAGFFLWLRTLTMQKLIDVHRHYLGTRKRGEVAEVSLHQAAPEASSLALADQLLAGGTGPAQSVLRKEVQRKVQDALNSLDPIDREVLVMRHFENLTNQEAADLLQLKKSTASKRYTVALRRLGEVLLTVDGFESGKL